MILTFRNMPLCPLQYPRCPHSNRRPILLLIDNLRTNQGLVHGYSIHLSKNFSLLIAYYSFTVDLSGRCYSPNSLAFSALSHATASSRLIFSNSPNEAVYREPGVTIAKHLNSSIHNVSSSNSHSSGLCFSPFQIYPDPKISPVILTHFLAAAMS